MISISQSDTLSLNGGIKFPSDGRLDGLGLHNRIDISRIFTKCSCECVQGRISPFAIHCRDHKESEGDF